jgi:hypothetical protein
MILELEQGFGGLVHISPQPMRQAVNALQTELEAELYEWHPYFFMSASATKQTWRTHYPDIRKRPFLIHLGHDT